jgi:hypothetical protein
MLTCETTPTQEHEGRAIRKGKGKGRVNDKGEGSNDPPPLKMKPFWKNEKMV